MNTMNSELPSRWRFDVTLWRLTACIAMVCLVGSGCGKYRAPITLHQVKGKVTVNGKPVEGICLQFHAIDAGSGVELPDGGKTEADGSFMVPVHEPGEYSVTAFWPTVTVVEGEQIDGVDRFNGYYRDLRRPVVKVTLREGENVLPSIALNTH
jgi:hypothetical protein